jgi:hypothetical protein
MVKLEGTVELLVGCKGWDAAVAVHNGSTAAATPRRKAKRFMAGAYVLSFR